MPVPLQGVALENISDFALKYGIENWDGFACVTYDLILHD